ncbi:MAG: 1-aminocyclopropane-1-carboxylate deaminase/D-cysteine desulfhydrase [Cyclobacteriaceae bacterium]|nr:MAG: 1-aminocyclopropane-1-carboxylate deaminase/D-cysteine desulfhydrase [Cyclobacteriaceae bacterium]
MDLQYTKTPVVEISTPEVARAGINLFIKREDQNHPHISGNKWWKLKYNLEAAQQQTHTTLLTFGGAYSNHIYATAAAAHELGLQSIGIIRGEETLPLNATLAFAKSRGMQLHYVSREAYRNRHLPEFTQSLHDRFGEFYIIPEGGTNELAIKGVAEFAQQLQQEASFDYLCLPVGTGGTMAGLIAGLEQQTQVVGISVLKNGEFLIDEVKNHLKNFSDQVYGNWHIETSYHHGGYAKTTPQLFAFIDTMNTEHQLPLDPVYTAKLMWGVMNMIEKGKFIPGSKVLILHTGGLQGLHGFR